MHTVVHLVHAFLEKKKKRVVSHLFHGCPDHLLGVRTDEHNAQALEVTHASTNESVCFRRRVEGLVLYPETHQVTSMRAAVSSTRTPNKKQEILALAGLLA